jgi:hypothetical protein
MMIYQIEPGLKQVIVTKMLEIGLDPNYKLYLIQIIRNFSPLYDAITFKGQMSFKNIDLKLVHIEFRVYHSTLLVSNSQSEFDLLRQLHTLNMTEDAKDRSWGCNKVLKPSEEKGVDGNTSYNCFSRIE